MAILDITQVPLLTLLVQSVYFLRGGLHPAALRPVIFRVIVTLNPVVDDVRSLLFTDITIFHIIVAN